MKEAGTCISRRPLVWRSSRSSSIMEHGLAIVRLPRACLSCMAGRRGRGCSSRADALIGQGKPASLDLARGWIAWPSPPPRPLPWQRSSVADHAASTWVTCRPWLSSFDDDDGYPRDDRGHSVGIDTQVLPTQRAPRSASNPFRLHGPDLQCTALKSTGCSPSCPRRESLAPSRPPTSYVPRNHT